MSSGVAPRPWRSTIAARAASSGSPFSTRSAGAVNSAPRFRLRERRHHDRRQIELQRLAPILVLWRQLERRSERLSRLVDRESRPVGRDLEEHATRLTEIDRMEVLAVDDRRHLPPAAEQ